MKSVNETISESGKPAPAGQSAAASPGFSSSRMPLEVFVALRYLKLWRAIAGCLLLSVVVVGLVSFGAEIIFAFKEWGISEWATVLKSAARLAAFAVALGLAVYGLAKLGRGHSGGVIMGIAIYGVTVGVAVLIIVLAVMSGFDRQMREKILGMNSHLIVTDPSSRVVAEPESTLALLRQTPHVVGAAPFILGHVLLEANGKVAPAMMKGIVPEQEAQVSDIALWVRSGTLDVSGDSVVVGEQLARQLGLMLHDKITVYSPKDFEKLKERRDEVYLPTELEVTGIFRVDMYEYDSKFLYVSLNTARDLYLLNEGVHGIGVKLDDAWNADVVRRGLQDKLPPDLAAITWAQMNRPIFSALRTEKAMMFFILLIITVVAAFGIASTLFTVSIQKTREVGLLKSLGATTRQVTAVFIMLGFWVGLLGTALGVAHGAVVLCYRNDVLEWLRLQTGWELFPAEVYSFPTIPAEVSVPDVLMIAASALLICTLAGLGPAIRSARLNAVEALRYE